MATPLSRLSNRPYAGDRELEPVLDLLLACRVGEHRERYPPLGRLRMLLVSRLWDPGRDARVWVDGTGRLVGLTALLQPRPDSPYRQLVWIVHPQVQGLDLHATMLTWALARVAESAGTGAQQDTPIRLSISVGEEEAEAIALLEGQGFVRGAVQTPYLARPLAAPPPEPAFPDGFTLRTLPEPDELGAYLEPYQPLFERRGLEHRRRLMCSPDYDPSLEVVVLAPDGAPAAYAECSVNRREWAHGGPREGWIDFVATFPAFRRRGLGRALLLTMLQHVQAAGAEMALLFTESTNTPALRLYRALGFSPVRTQVWYGRDVAQVSGTEPCLSTSD